MKQKILLFAMSAILLASCASKKIERAREEGKTQGKKSAMHKYNERLRQVMDSMSNLNKIVIHDTVTKTLSNNDAEKKPTDAPTKDYVFQASFSIDYFIGYPELNGKFYRVSPIYMDSTIHTGKDKKDYYTYEMKKIDIYIPILEYNIIKQKNKTKVVTLYASWMKLCGGEMHSFEFKGTDCIDVFGGIHYSDPGVKVNFTPVTINEDPPVGEPGSQIKIDPGEPVNGQGNNCRNTQEHCKMLGKNLNTKTCDCE